MKLYHPSYNELYHLCLGNSRTASGNAAPALFPFITGDQKFGHDQPPDGTDFATLGVEIATGKKAGFPRFQFVTALDGVSEAREHPRRDPYLEQSRFIVRWAKAAVVIWDGEMPAGPGGTGDTVRLAIAKGIPVIWIDVGEGLKTPAVRLILASNVWTDGSFSEFCRALVRGKRESAAPPLDTEQLALALGDQYAPPVGAAAPVHGSAAALVDDETAGRLHFADPSAGNNCITRCLIDAVFRLGTKSWEIAFGLMALGWKRGWHPPIQPAANPLSPETATQRGYRLIEQESKNADAIATRSGNTHRAVQFLLLLIAFFAVLSGTLPALFENAKFEFVSIELCLVIAALAIWKAKVMQSNHLRWSDTRRYAERLRALKATWPLAFDVADNTADKPKTWTEWRARSIKRIAGPPTGAMLDERVSRDADHARDDEGGIVSGQHCYHNKNVACMGKAHRNLHALEVFAFFLLLAALALFVIAYVARETHAAQSLNSLLNTWLSDHWAQTAKMFLLILSAVIPALGAAVIALEAKIGFEENSVRHRRLEPEFARLFHAISGSIASGHGQGSPDAPEIDPAPTAADKAELLREAAQLHISDADSWRDGMTRRQMVKI